MSSQYQYVRINQALPSIPMVQRMPRNNPTIDMYRHFRINTGIKPFLLIYNH